MAAAAVAAAAAAAAGAASRCRPRCASPKQLWLRGLRMRPGCTLLALVASLMLLLLLRLLWCPADTPARFR